MEACCFDVFLIGLVGIHTLGSSTPLLPLWFFSRRTPPIPKSNHRSAMIEQDRVTIPYAIYDIRVLYRSLLKEAASQGYPRQQYETPFEFETRLAEHLPSLKSLLTTITKLYVAARYDEYIPQETEIAHIHSLWASLYQTSTQGG